MRYKNLNLICSSVGEFLRKSELLTFGFFVIFASRQRRSIRKEPQIDSRLPKSGITSMGLDFRCMSSRTFGTTHGTGQVPGRICKSRDIFNLGSDPSPLAREDRLVEGGRLIVRSVRKEICRWFQEFQAEWYQRCLMVGENGGACRY